MSTCLSNVEKSKARNRSRHMANVPMNSPEPFVSCFSVGGSVFYVISRPCLPVSPCFRVIFCSSGPCVLRAGSRDSQGSYVLIHAEWKMEEMNFHWQVCKPAHTSVPAHGNTATASQNCTGTGRVFSHPVQSVSNLMGTAPICCVCGKTNVPPTFPRWMAGTERIKLIYGSRVPTFVRSFTP